VANQVQKFYWSEVQIRDFVAARKTSNPHLQSGLGTKIGNRDESF